MDYTDYKVVERDGRNEVWWYRDEPKPGPAEISEAAAKEFPNIPVGELEVVPYEHVPHFIILRPRKKGERAI